MASFVCPVCGSLAKIYASRPFSATAREMFLACSNERCEHSFRSLYDILNTILPSALPEDDPERLPPGAAALLKIRIRKQDREAREKAREHRQHAIESLERLKQSNAELQARIAKKHEAEEEAGAISGSDETVTRTRLAWLREQMCTEPHTARAIGCTEEELMKSEGPISKAFAKAVKDAYDRLRI